VRDLEAEIGRLDADKAEALPLAIEAAS